MDVRLGPLLKSIIFMLFEDCAHKHVGNEMGKKAVQYWDISLVSS